MQTVYINYVYWYADCVFKYIDCRVFCRVLHNILHNLFSICSLRMYFLVYFLQVSPPCFLVSSGSCINPRILAYSYPQVHVCLLVSSHPHILIPSGSCLLVHICTSLHPHTLRYICACQHPCILTSLYSEVHLCLLASLHPHILIYSGACILISSHPHILMSYSQVCVCLLVSSHPHISYPQVHACLLVSLHPHILRFMCVSFYPCILSSSYAQIRVCLHPTILISSGPQAYVICMLIDIVASSHHHSLVS